jgi:ubiquinone/menaquinone biosynthesis C-methylase UbiE
MPLPDGRFSGVTCFTMLHHVPSPEMQDKVLSEACRVLRPGGVLAGTDSLGGGIAFKLLHIADTFVRVPPETLPDRLHAAGFEDPRVEANATTVRFSARKPATV